MEEEQTFLHTVIFVSIFLMICCNTFLNVLILLDISNLKYIIENNQNNDLIFTNQLLNKFAENHEYEKGVYNCVNYSEDLAYIGKQLGVNIEVTGGWNPDDNRSGHQWDKFCVDFEPQTASIIDYSDDFPIAYKRYNKGNNDT